MSVCGCVRECYDVCVLFVCWVNGYVYMYVLCLLKCMYVCIGVNVCVCRCVCWSTEMRACNVCMYKCVLDARVCKCMRAFGCTCMRG